MLAVLPALAVLCSSAAVLARQSGLARDRTSIGDWHLTVTTDRFSGERRCAIARHRGNAWYARRLVVFDVGRAINPSDIVIRIDDGDAIRWRDIIPEVARLDPSFASNRNARWVPIPAAMIQGARVVAIAPSFGKKPRSFRVGRFGEMYDQAVELGCRTDTAFRHQ